MNKIVPIKWTFPGDEIEQFTIFGGILRLMAKRNALLVIREQVAEVVAAGRVGDPFTVWRGWRAVAVALVRAGLADRVSNNPRWDAYRINERGRAVVLAGVSCVVKMRREIGALRNIVAALEAEPALKEKLVATEVAATEEREPWLTGHENTILSVMRAHPGRLVTREALMLAIYGHNRDRAEISILDVFMCKLRKKLAVHSPSEKIVTVRGRGYRHEMGGTE